MKIVDEPARNLRQ